jgi:hypothetical protein
MGGSCGVVTPSIMAGRKGHRKGQLTWEGVTPLDQPFGNFFSPRHTLVNDPVAKNATRSQMKKRGGKNRIGPQSLTVAVGEP